MPTSPKPKRKPGVARLDRRVGRTDPPQFAFSALRTAILNRLQSGGELTAKTIAIVAPVGYGKTVLMAMLLENLRNSGKQCAWLSLDDRDVAVDGILGDLESILRGRDVKLHPTHALFRGDDPAEARIDTLVERVNHNPLPITLFIDNLQHCSDPLLGRLLDRLLFSTRPTVRLVLSSTHEIPLDVARARLEGLIRQIGADELSFSVAEVADFLGTALCRRIGLPGVESMTRQTEGWPAAIRMMQIILEGAEHPQQVLRTFSGSDESLAQLLNRQVLSGFPPKIREFLLCLAQLRTFCTELCAAAIDARSSRSSIAYLIERNVFVIPLDRNRNWYRLHGLFRDHLLHEAETALPAERRREVLARAVRWCETNGYWREAVDYALQSGSIASANSILERIAAWFVRDRGDVQQYIRWLEALHGLGAEAGPEAEYWYVWALAFHRRYDYARQRAGALSARMQRHGKGQATTSSDLRRRIEILRTSIDSLTDHLADAHKGAARWLAAARASDDPFNQTAAHCIECCYFTNGLSFVEARQAIQAARETAARTKSAYVDGWVWSYTGLAAIAAGDYAGIYSDLVNALAAVRTALGDEAGICGTMSLVAARCAVGMGLDADARQLVEFGLKTARTHGFLEAAGAGLEAAVMLWSGADDDLFNISAHREIAGAYPPRLSLMLSCWLCRRLIQLERLDEAAAEAARAGLDIEATSRRTVAPSGIAQLDALLAAMRIELLISQGRDQPASRLIAKALRQAKATSCQARLVELELDSAILAIRDDDHGLSVRHVTRAVRLAAARRIVRPFTDHAAVIATVVSKTKVSAWGFALDGERRFFAEICRKVAGEGQALKGSMIELHDQPRLLAPLTPRELELLGFIHAGLSNQQLADRTDVSLTTVKWHLQNLYGKLGVSSRSAALARARALKLPVGRDH